MMDTTLEPDQLDDGARPRSAPIPLEPFTCTATPTGYHFGPPSPPMRVRDPETGRRLPKPVPIEVERTLPLDLPVDDDEAYMQHPAVLAEIAKLAEASGMTAEEWLGDVEPEPEPVSPKVAHTAGYDPRQNDLANELDEMLAFVREHGGAPAEIRRTLMDIVLAEHTEDYCVLGPRFASLNRRDRKYRSQYARCQGGKCPRCVDWYIHRTIWRALSERLDCASEVWCTTFPTYEDLRSARNRLPKGLFWIRAADGSATTFTLEPLPFGRGVKSVTTVALLEALLNAAAYPGKTERRHAQLPKEPEPERDELERWVPISKSRRVEDVNLRVGMALERPVDWVGAREIGKRRSAYTARWSLELEEHELDAVDQVLDAVGAESSEELARMRGQRLVGWLPLPVSSS
jgi:hypothetical protein